MVMALLDDRKSQTRRLVTAQNSLLDGGPCSKKTWSELQFDGAWVDNGPSPAGNPGPYLKVPRIAWGDKLVHRIYPRIWAGDRLYVREAIEDSGHFVAAGVHGVRYCADGALHPDANWVWQRGKLPSIHMPWGLSRIQLEVTSVRPERLQDITEEDAYAEGVAGTLPEDVAVSARHEFEILWDQLNLKRAPWASNPWVWVVEFQRLGP